MIMARRIISMTITKMMKFLTWMPSLSVPKTRQILLQVTIKLLQALL